MYRARAAGGVSTGRPEQDLLTLELVADCSTSHTLVHLRGFWVVSATVALFVILAIGVGVSVATDGNNSAKATRETPVQRTCAEALLKDWADGRIDGSYQLACYRVALRSLPTDLQVYSSASEDITQALSQRIVQSVKSTPGEASRRPAG